MTEVLSAGLRRRLAGVEERYEELERSVGDPATTSDRNRIREVGQELSSLTPIVETIRSLRDAEPRLAAAQRAARCHDPPAGRELRADLADPVPVPRRRGLADRPPALLLARLHSRHPSPRSAPH